MCGIGGFSLSEKSNLNSRKLANAMLTLLESRGSQASGAAWHARSGVGYTKRDVRGSALNLKALPRKTDAVILHTRYATHGTTRNMANNHPVMSPDGTTQLVHNGVIYNHDMLRQELPFKLPEVDSSVIPAVMQESSVDGFSKLDGDAAVAWLTANKQGNLHLARISHSPLVVCQVKDGSFFFASTESILQDFLKRVGLKSTFWLVMPERSGYVVRKGRIVETLNIPELDPAYEMPVSASAYSNFRYMTAGGKGKRSGNLFDAGSSWWDDTPAEPMSEIESDFEDWLQENFLYHGGDYFDFDGYYAGDREELLEQFERVSYKNFWSEKEAEFMH